MFIKNLGVRLRVRTQHVAFLINIVLHSRCSVRMQIYPDNVTTTPCHFNFSQLGAKKAPLRQFGRQGMGDV
jgi:hypothetical protein